MKTIIVDDEHWVLKELESYCNEIKSINLIGKFTNSKDVINFAEENFIELAILDIKLPEINGLELCRILRNIYPNIVIIFSTAYKNYALEAYKLHSIAYILKPFNMEEFEYAITTAKALINNQNSILHKNKVFINTFGRFDVFIDNELVVFKRAKSKELLALLVDMQGGLVTIEQAVSVLWENRPYNSNVKQMYRDATSQLRNTLMQYNCSSLVKIIRGGCYIDVNEFECDYYQLLKNDKKAILSFNGEYMFDYSWAEHTLAKLLLLKKSHIE
ncbi:response regulator [Anaerovorax odorimutans]|uniref:response regulator n=1 Tax=Anaerovorax odorimutans TaxID=109327 RepID=UPI00041095B8|nr:response regulator [Anaerovorax odorimutans]